MVRSLYVLIPATKYLIQDCSRISLIVPLLTPIAVRESSYHGASK